MNTIIKNAAAATTKCQDEIASITDVLAMPYAVNGFGVFQDRLTAIADLLAIQRNAGAGVEALRSCPWPTEDDYIQWRGP